MRERAVYSCLRAVLGSTLAESARLFAEAIEKGATHPNVFYNAACSYALAGDAGQAFRFLDRAVDAGYRDAKHLKVDADLASLRDDARWRAVVARTEAARVAPRNSSADNQPGLVRTPSHPQGESP